MNLDNLLWLVFIFLFYSFIGWCLEVIIVAIREKKYVNRGISNGPLCTVYGLSAVLITLVFRDFDQSYEILWLFLGSAIYATALEFIAGKLLEKLNKAKWWDYSNRKFNLDGYICLEYSLLWGTLGVLVSNIFNPLLLLLYNNINFYIKLISLSVILGIVLIDILTSFVTLKKIKTAKISNLTNNFGNWILKSVINRLENAYPNFKKKLRPNKSEKFASGVGFYKLFWIFLIAAFVGDIVEIFWCRYAMGRWMSRSSLVWGQFSLVWGLAIMLATLLLNRYKNKTNTFLFITGTVFGGAFEYICSVFTEYVFGTIYWDYSGIPFNLNGRINLLFCFFWGFATVMYVKLVFPRLSKLIEKIPAKIGYILTYIMIIFLSVDLVVSICVVNRYTERVNGVEATNFIDRLCDEYAPDDFIKTRWSNMKFPQKKSKK